MLRQLLSVCMKLFFGLGLVLDMKGSLGMILVLILIFVFVLVHALNMGYDIDCGCFGPNDPELKAFASIRTALARDLFMIAIVLYLYVWRARYAYIPRPFIKNNQGEN